MAILENLAQGFAQAANAPEAAAGIQKVKDDRRAMAHEELEANTHSILDDVKKLQARRASLDPKSPTYQKDIGEIDSQLHQARQAFTDLYHPAKNPGALAKFGGFLRSHSAKQQADQSLDAGPRNIPATPREARQRFDLAGLDAAAAGPGQARENPIAQKVKDLEAIGVPHDEAVRLASGQKEAPGKYGLVSGTIDGQPVTFQHGADGSWKTLSGEEVDPAVIGKFQPTAKTAPGSTSKFNEEVQVYEKQWGKKRADWSLEELSYFNQKMAYDAQRSGQSTTTRLEKDANGQIHPVEITNTRGPMAPPVDPHAGREPVIPGGNKSNPVSAPTRTPVVPGQGGDRTPAFNAPTKAEGMVTPGNINLGGRPILTGPDGKISSELSFSRSDDPKYPGKEVLVPLITDGQFPPEWPQYLQTHDPNLLKQMQDRAWRAHIQTGQHMGIFDTPAHADAYAQAIHNRKIPRTPGEARHRAAAVAPKGTVKELPALSFRGSTPQYTKAKIDYDAALKLDSIAKQVEQNPNDAINQKRLAVALERASAGRFTQQALDYIRQAGLANSIEGWANKATTGALPTDVMRQLIDGAHQNLIASKAALDDASGGTSGGDDDVNAIIKALKTQKQ